MLCDVVIPKAGHNVYTYKCNDDVQRGDLVEVPFGKGIARGVVIEIYQEKQLPFEIKNTRKIIFPHFSIKGIRLKLLDFITKYYVSFYSEAVPLFFPPGILERSKIECRYKKNSTVKITGSRKKEEIANFLKERYPRWIKRATLTKLFGSGAGNIVNELKEKGIIECREKLITSKPKPFKPLNYYLTRRKIIKLTPQQQKVYNAVMQAMKEKRHETFLLYGITGSGKTAIYYKLFEYILDNNLSGIFLVPEIALTVQTLTYFLEKYGERVFVYHSGLRNSEKNWIYETVSNKESFVVIGPRSALFLPYRNISLIVIDEEHDISYKEEERMPRYDAREVAKYMASSLNIPLLLGSGTPDVVSFYKAREEIYNFHLLLERYEEYREPQIEIVDMRKEERGSIFSITLLAEMQRSLNRKKGIILFINRRGYNPVIQCLDCGKIIQCPHCSVPLVVHKKSHTVKCHMCGYTEEIPEICPYCGSFNIQFIGYGTEKTEEEVKRFFPDAKVGILDRDTIQKKGAKEKIYTEFLEGKLQILIGTQMLSVGFDFPNVETVGVLNADIGLGFPDFRAEERVAQTLFQVSGRLRKEGKVIVQTKTPEHPIFTYLKDHNFGAFLLYELDNRKRYKYPPFINLIRVITRSKNTNLGREIIEKIHASLTEKFNSHIEILGPAPPLYYKIRDEYRWHLIIKAPDTLLNSLLGTLLEERIKYKDQRNLKILVDVNPYSVL